MKAALSPRLAFVVITFLVCTMLAAYIVYAALNRQQRREFAEQALAVATNCMPEIQAESYVAFRNTALGAGYGCLSFVPLDEPGQARTITQLPCDRVYVTPDRGFALQAARGVFTTFKAVGFDRDLNALATFKLVGVPSRTRVSVDGTYAASTVFVSGDSYNSGSFSTRTVIYDLNSASIIGDLEEFSAEMEGRPFRRIDFNYWGVTFVPNTDDFFATLGTGGVFYLVKGSISGRRIEVVRDEVECPSLSPDGQRIAYKWRTKEDGRLIWRLRVMQLETDEVITVNEYRSVDDQVEWVDSERILYGLPRNIAGSGSSDVWIARADGTGEPELFIANASSPSVVRR